MNRRQDRRKVSLNDEAFALLARAKAEMSAKVGRRVSYDTFLQKTLSPGRKVCVVSSDNEPLAEFDNIRVIINSGRGKSGGIGYVTLGYVVELALESGFMAQEILPGQLDVFEV